MRASQSAGNGGISAGIAGSAGSGAAAGRPFSLTLEKPIDSSSTPSKQGNVSSPVSKQKAAESKPVHETEQNPPLAPAASALDTEPESSSWQDILLLRTLSSIERAAVLAFLLLSVYLSSSSWNPLDLLQEALASAAAALEQSLDMFTSIDLWAVQWPRLILVTAMGMCLSHVLDEDTKKTDRALLTAANMLVTSVGNSLLMLQGVLERSSRVLTSLIFFFRESALRILHTVQRIPRVLRYMLAIALGVMWMRWFIRRSLPVIVSSFENWTPYLLSTAAVVVLGTVLYRTIASYLHRRKAMKLAVQVVLTHVKSKLVDLNRPYPADYLLAELTDQALDLHGMALADVWKEVQKEIKKDKRLQAVDMLVDGRQQTCWRMLSGQPHSALASFFGGTKFI